MICIFIVLIRRTFLLACLLASDIILTKNSMCPSSSLLLHSIRYFNLEHTCYKFDFVYFVSSSFFFCEKKTLMCSCCDIQIVDLIRIHFFFGAMQRDEEEGATPSNGVFQGKHMFFRYNTLMSNLLLHHHQHHLLWMCVCVVELPSTDTVRWTKTK